MATGNIDSSNLKGFIGRWGINQQLFVDIAQKVHPDDLGKEKNTHSPRLVYYVEGVEGVEGGYLCLRYRDFRLRAKPEGFVVVESPSCSFDERILIRRTTGKIDEATVIGPTWHYGPSLAYFVFAWRCTAAKISRATDRRHSTV